MKTKQNVNRKIANGGKCIFLTMVNNKQCSTFTDLFFKELFISHMKFSHD